MRIRCHPRAVYPYDPTEDDADYWHAEEDLFAEAGKMVCRRCGRAVEEGEEDGIEGNDGRTLDRDKNRIRPRFSFAS